VSNARRSQFAARTTLRRRRIALSAGLAGAALAAALSVTLLGRSHGDPRAATSRASSPVHLAAQPPHSPAPPNVRIGSAVYVFGGGTNAGTQSDAIVRVPTNGGTARDVGRLPAPSSDQAAAAIGGTAHIVGGELVVAGRPRRLHVRGLSREGLPSGTLPNTDPGEQPGYQEHASPDNDTKEARTNPLAVTRIASNPRPHHARPQAHGTAALVLHCRRLPES
jgi:hypothetical protein